jgi:hypothetical protein
MISRLLVGLALVASVVTVSPASAQGAAAPTVADSGIKVANAVMRVSLYRFAEGMQPAAITDLRTHLIPIWEAERQAGVIVNYSTMSNTNRRTEDDWQLGIAITYWNYAALDSLGARTNPITLKHYGSEAARTAANEARAKLRIQVSSQLINVASYSRK